jgi:hypothetical protein
MCRNIKILFNFDPPVTDEEIRNASLQFVRKISGFSKPSQANQANFESAVDEIATASTRLLHSLKTTASPRNRKEEAAKLKARSAARFGTSPT